MIAQPHSTLQKRGKWLRFLWIAISIVAIFLLVRFTFALSSEPYTFEYTTLYSDSSHSERDKKVSPIAYKIIPNKIFYYDLGKPFRVFNNYKRIRKQPDSNAINILIDGEASMFNLDYNYDVIITTKKLNREQYPKHIYVPFWSMSFAEIEGYTPDRLLYTHQIPKSKFCAFMYSNCDPAYEGVRLREQFLLQLSQLRAVDSLGKCHNNVKQQDTRKIANFLDHAIETYKPYRFVIAFENTSEPGYITEKLILPILAGCIPIYLGAPDVETQFNPERFIHVRRYASWESCIQDVLEIDQDPKRFEAMIQKPAIQPQVLYEQVGWYYKHPAFYERFYELLPKLTCPNYIPFAFYSPEENKPIKVINLDRSTDRWASMVKQFNRKPDLAYQRFSAVDGKLALQRYKSVIQNKKYKLNNSEHELNVGEIGVYLSNMEISYALIHDPYSEYYLVLEDDVIIDNLEHPDVYAKEAPIDWDIIFLGYHKDFCKINSAEKYKRMEYTCMPGNFAYMIRKRAAQFYVNFGFPIEIPIDEFQRMCSHNLNMYTRHPAVITTHYENQSTVHQTDVIL